MLLGIHHLVGIFIFVLFLSISRSDLKFHRIPNFSVAALFLGELLFLQDALDSGTLQRFVVTLTVYFSFAILTRGALGSGDIKLACALSLMSSTWSQLYLMNSIAWFCAFLALPILMLSKRSGWKMGGWKMGGWREIRIPFAPFLIGPACLLVFKRW